MPRPMPEEIEIYFTGADDNGYNRYIVVDIDGEVTHFYRHQVLAANEFAEDAAGPDTFVTLSPAFALELDQIMQYYDEK